MALNRKYAALPDLDSAPDIYETPELTDDNSTAPTGRAHSQSTSSSYKDFDEEDDTPGISRSHLHPNEARSHFSPAQIDARDVDFSDRVTAKRKSYKASSRRYKTREDGTQEYGDFSDEEDGESLERKLARLKREIEEVKEAYGRRQAEKKDTDVDDGRNLEPDVIALSKMLDGISSSQAGPPESVSVKFAKDLGTGIKANGPPHTSQGKGEPATYTVTYAPTYQQSHALAKAADFDGRLALLEKALGLDPITLNSNGSPKAILPTLDTLQRQVSLISESTPSSLDSISRRVRTLTQEAERLEETRKAAKAAQDALRAAGGDIASEDGEDSEQMSKIHALYGTLPTIENIAPLLPSLLDRLRSLRAIHADAATASESLDAVEMKQVEMAGDIKKWREGLEKVEEALKQSETVMGGNMKVVEGWVKDLEQKMEKFPAQMAFIEVNDDDAAESNYRNFGPRGHEAGSRAEEFKDDIKVTQRRRRTATGADMASWAGQPHIKGSTEALRMMLLTFSLVGLQFTWGIEMTYCTPYLLQLGLTKSKTSLVWIAGPLSGLIMQPIVGVFADRSTSKYGRRRPFMVLGSFVVAICLLVLGFTKEIVGYFVKEGEFRKTCTITVAVLSIYAVDFAINAVQACCRALIVDTLPIPKQQTGGAWASRMVSLGHLVGYIIGMVDLVAMFGTSWGDTQFKKLTIVSALALIISVGITSWAVTERVLISSKASNSSDGILKVIAQIFRTATSLPPKIQAICTVQWIGWFPFLFYSTTWVGETYFRFDAPTSAKDSKDALGDIGRIGSMSLVVFSLVTTTGAFLLPLLIKSPDEAGFTARPPPAIAGLITKVNKYKPDLLTAWIAGHILFSCAMFLAPFAHSFRFATFLVALCGFPWAIACWAPNTFLGIEVNRLSSGGGSYRRLSIDSIEMNSPNAPGGPSLLRLEHGLGDEPVASTGELSGLYFGILNIYTTIPQFIGTFISMIVFSILEPGKSPELAHDAKPEEHHGTDGPNAIAVCLFIGAVSTIGAAFATKRLRDLQ
ncbi:hypothetical protein G7Y89_g3734 [Cudoniella acicularis]|uniref:Sucrose transporter n=1 Tax=Cudoniella acicularis TaxID=354080 RepID=A0A8H4RS50_9HELO|nr:hypothetical protein G7Y89_g3734 [Cudoniella acicularis]